MSVLLRSIVTAEAMIKVTLLSFAKIWLIPASIKNKKIIIIKYIDQAVLPRYTVATQTNIKRKAALRHIVVI